MLICRMRPFYERKDENPRKSLEQKRRRVYIMNLPYDVLPEEVMLVLKEFAEVDELVLPRDPNGYTRGYGFAYLKHEEDIDHVINYVD